MGVAVASIAAMDVASAAIDVVSVAIYFTCAAMDVTSIITMYVDCTAMDVAYYTSTAIDVAWTACNGFLQHCSQDHLCCNERCMQVTNVASAVIKCINTMDVSMASTGMDFLIISTAMAERRQYYKRRRQYECRNGRRLCCTGLYIVSTAFNVRRLLCNMHMYRNFHKVSTTIRFWNWIQSRLANVFDRGNSPRPNAMWRQSN
jgi:hypothetical protein